MKTVQEVHAAIPYRLDTSYIDAFAQQVEATFGNNIYSARREYIISCTADDIHEFFSSQFTCNCRISNGNHCYVWGEDWAVRFFGNFGDKRRLGKHRYDGEITFTGSSQNTVMDIIAQFEHKFRDLMIPEHYSVNMIVRSKDGLERVSLPVKTDRKFYPEMYPCIDDPDSFIERFMTSSANVLILIGPPGLGKSALINHIILNSCVPTSIVFDPEVMNDDHLYTDFINHSLRDEGGLMVLEDSDIVLQGRVISQNVTMSKLLNLSDGIVDTSGAKFIFSANLSSKKDIDEALIRPGRCFDVVEFRNLTYEEAVRAADAIGVELFTKKDEYTVAEIFNSTANRTTTRKVGFI